MSKRFLGFCALMLVLPSMAQAQSFSVVLTAGYISQNATTALNSTATPNGALLLLIAAGGSNGQSFTAQPAAGQFVSGGDVVLGASSFNANVALKSNGIGKATQNSFLSLTLPTTTSATAYIELRWYPNITLAQYNAGATPAAGSTFGAYNPLITNLSGNTTLNPDGGDLWSLPTNGTINLNFLTTDTGAAGAKQVVGEGYANFTVPVPEPSAGTLSGLGMAVVIGVARLWRRSKIV